MMSSLMILLLILILTFGYCDKINALEKIEQGKNLSPTTDRVSFLDRINYVTLNLTGKSEKDSSLRNKRLRQDLQHVMSTMVKKIIYKRRMKQIEMVNDRARDRIYGDKGEIGTSLVGNRLESDERVTRNDNKTYNAIHEQASRDLYQISKNLMSIVRRSVNPKLSTARSYREEFTKREINSGNRQENRSLLPISRRSVNPITTRIRNYRKDSGKRGNKLKNRPKNRHGSRVKRDNKDAWIKRDFEDHETNMKMHALVVRDEDIPPCCTPAKEVTNQRYFMCSGAMLTLKHAITTASCMHYADIYEHHIDADLAILVGATSPRAYVIKINRYEMHPDYDYDVDSKNHATNNVAILYLACSIVERDSIPSLPKGLNDDVAHMCCRESCDLITVVQSINNRHTARVLKARHLPAPRHDDDVPNYRQLSNAPFEATRRFNKQTLANGTFPLSRGKRSPVKLAPAPIFFSKEPRSLFRLPSSTKPVEATNSRRMNKTKAAQGKRAKNQQPERKIKKPLNLSDLTNRRKTVAQIPILRALEDTGVNVEEQLAAVDWEKIEETMAKKFTDGNREKMNIFAKSVVDETMKRLESAIGDEGDGLSGSGGVDGTKLGVSATGGNGNSVFEKLMPTDSRQKTIDSFVKVFTKVVTSLVPPNSPVSLSVSSDISVEEKDLKDPPPIYEKCPPLGSPIFIDGTLIALLAYTCDDVQESVEWKYVNIAKNMNWIRNRMSTEYKPGVTCGETEKSTQQHRSLPDATRSIDAKNLFGENSTDIRRDRRLEWPSGELSLDKRRSFSIGNFDDSRISVTVAPPRIFKDSWFARNSRFTPRQPMRDDIPLSSRNQPKASMFNIPLYNVNTCYVRSDGTTDCQPQTDFNIR